MSEMFSLLKVQLLSLFGVNKYLHKKRKGKKSKKSTLVILLVALLLFCGGYVFFYTKSYFGIAENALATDKSVKGFYSLVFSGLFLFSFVTSMFNVLGGFYKSKDMELILSFPIKKVYVVISKFIRIIVFGIAISAFIFISSYLAIRVYDIKSDGNVVLICLSLIFSDLIATSIGFFVGTIILYICSFFRAKNFWQLVFVLAFFIALVFLPKAFGKNVKYLFDKLQNFGKWTQSGLKEFLIYFAISLISIAVTVTLTNLVFTGVKNAVSKVKHAKKVKANGINSPFASEIKRNLKRFFSSATFSVNSLIGPVLAIVTGSISISLRNTELFEGGNIGTLGMIIFGIFITITMLFVGLSSPSAVSVSMEGKTLWVLRSSPVKARTIIFAKFLLCALPSFIALTYSSVMFNVFVVGKINRMAIIYSVVVSIGIPIVISSWGLLVNLLFPSLDWENETQVVKRSASATIFVFLTIAFSFIQGLYVDLYFKIKKHTLSSFSTVFDSLATFTIIFTLVLVASGVSLLFTFGVKRFKKISG